MNLLAKYTGLNARKEAAAKPPFGPCFNAEIVARTETLEIHGTKVNDLGPDFCEMRALDADGGLLAKKKVKGY